MPYNHFCANHLDENIEHRHECTLCNSKGMVTDDAKKLICPIVKKQLKLMGETCNMFVGEKMTKKQIVEDRQKRSHAHFKKEIYPTLGPSEKAHHIAKNKRRKK